MAGVKRPLDVIDDNNPSKSAKTEEVPPAGTIRSYAYIPTTGPCYEAPIDLRFPLHWSSSLFPDGDLPGAQPVELAAARSAVSHEPGDLGVVVTLAAASEVYHIPGSRCPPFFLIEISDGTKWGVWKDIQGTVFKAITKHFAHLEGFDRPVMRWSVPSENPDLDEDFGLSWDFEGIPQRPPTSSAAATRITTLTEAYVPSTGPPYETPLDLRFPLHWDRPRIARSVQYEERSPEGAAVQAARDDLWNCIFYPEKLYLRRCIAGDIPHYPEGISEPYFEVEIDTSEAWSMDIHQYVSATIEARFGHGKHIIRYIAGGRRVEDVDSDDATCWVDEDFDFD